MTRLTWSDELSKRIREGDWDDQAASTVGRIEEAIDVGDGESAAQLLDYFMEETKVVYRIYDVWYTGLEEWLHNEGVSPRDLEAEILRIRSLLRFPDGSEFEPASTWESLGARAGSLGNRLRVGTIDQAEARQHVDGICEDWRQLHDRWVDFLSGLFTFIAARFGEPRLEDAYRYLLEPYVQERYMPYDLREQAYEETIYRNLYTSFEAMRAHLVGPQRRGDIEFEETGDSWVLRFDPCGSGGRSSRGDPIEGTGPRPDPPYNFGVTEGEYDWAWNEKGICYYCAHCCLALELLPAERWGHPVRVVDSPRYPDETSGDEPAKCTWTIYKSIEAIPEEAYRRIGRTKPDA